MRKGVVWMVVLLCALIPAAAQNTGRVSGTVMDASGAVIPGASVQLALADGGLAASTESSAEGLFSFIGIRPGTYSVTVESKGFAKKVLREIKVEPGRETSLPPISLEVGTVADVMEVTATVQGIQTTNAELSTTITQDQMRRLPMLNRNPLALISTQPGVTYNGYENTTINGQRTSYSNITIDGINVQDNYIRTNALDFIPNRLMLDQVSEVTILTANPSAAFGNGSSQVIFVTPSGSNAYHGSVYWQNRNRVAAANTWFNNRDGVARPAYNQNQGGGAFGGRIVRDKLFFYTNYEAFRLHQRTSYNTTILTPDARRGIFTYQSGTAVNKVNLLQAAGVSANSMVAQIIQKQPTTINNYRVGDSSESLLRNTAGHSVPDRYNTRRDNITGKIDYIRSTRHVFTGTFAWNQDIVDRPDAATNYWDPVPAVSNDDHRKLVSGTWRWNPWPAFTNELRGGFNLSPALFVVSGDLPKYLLTGFLFTQGVNTFLPQGRYTNTFNLQDNANWVRGRHSLQFGYQMQLLRTNPYNYASVVPTYTVTIGAGRNPGLTAADLPGISATDLNNANTLLANLAGYVSAYTQTFQVKSRTSGYVSGAPSDRHYRVNNYAGYFQDNWKVLPRLTLNLGLRYDYYSPVDERDSLFLMPVLQNNNPIATLMSNATLDFAGSSAGRPWYNKDLNNFAPVVGLAWDVFGNGKTALRAGYSISYVNDEMVRATANNLTSNAGLSATSAASALTANLNNLPAVPVPTYKVPRTTAENFANNPSGNAQGMPDPNLRTPYVQQWNIGIQHSVRGVVVEVRYVGNHSTKAWRGVDYNQVVINENGFLDDFKRAYNNGLLAQRQTGVFRPAYNPSIPGSQPLPVFDRLGNANLTNSTIVNLIQTQQVGELASQYFTTRTAGSVSFYRNPYGLGMNMLSNYSNSNYNGLQIDVRKQTARGLYIQGNYTWSKSLSDSLGDDQTRFEAFLDMNNPKIERSRTPFDLNHQIKINGNYELPLGKGHRITGGRLERLIAGWFVAGIFTWQTGNPFSVLSGRGTLNRSARSTWNTVDTTLTGDQLRDLFQFRQTGSGPYFVAASAIGSDGRAVAGDGLAPFPGQVFYQPTAGTIGSLQRRFFTGPSAWGLDSSIGKLTKINERFKLDIRMIATNIFNHPTWYVGDQTVTSTNFGRISSSLFGRRIVQFGATLRF